MERKTDEEYREIFHKKLNYYMDINNKTQSDIVNDLGISQSTVSNWCTGLKLPRMGKIQLLSDYFGINKSDLIEENTTKAGERSTGIKIPVLGRVPAGIPLEAIEDIIDYEEIPEKLAKDGEFFCLQIKGDSMEPRICEGDVVIVRKQEDAESGDLVIAMINGNEATCKRLMKYADGIRLLPSNPSYEPLYFTNEEIEETPVKIIGRVVENRQKY